MVELTAKHPALVVIDMQNSFVHPDGGIAQMGLDMSAPRAIVPTVKKLIDAAHDLDVPVIYTRIVYQPDYSDAGLLAEQFPAMIDRQALIAGTWDGDILDDLQPAEGDFVIDKTRYSAFIGTTFEDVLKEIGADGVIMTGVTTNVCVESTARDAFQRGYKVILVSDAVAGNDPVTRHGTLESVRYCLGQVATADEVIAALRRHQPASVRVAG